MYAAAIREEGKRSVLLTSTQYHCPVVLTSKSQDRPMSMSKANGDVHKREQIDEDVIVLNTHLDTDRLP